MTFLVSGGSTKGEGIVEIPERGVHFGWWWKVVCGGRLAAPLGVCMCFLQFYVFDMN